ncbi:hypothetical protein [Actinophytocola algeriensis]|uniref:Uncharacterized protein n=1 Tax=Actinophytocola algeriensis TaxID=1768010 RepID=A0A7W7Q7L1_9PSEU|nr:hypothetical protein [Actinophytocola algeriensis]MBB4908469.1 hypothetical protein [Actinophytocola algeriensis]MBE1475144.1 hypothetical protein [Actinophytocola algeriensis]
MSRVVINNSRRRGERSPTTTNTNRPHSVKSATTSPASALPHSSTVDDGETANVSYGKEKVGDEYGFALHTEQRG